MTGGYESTLTQKREKSNGYKHSILTDLSSIKFFGFHKFNIPPLPKKSHSHAMVLTNDNEILICGKSHWQDRKEFCNSKKKYVIRDEKVPGRKCLKLEKDKWVHHSTLNFEREDFTAITMPNGIYLYGGSSSKTLQGEFLENGSTKWELGPSLDPFWSSIHGRISGLRITNDEFVLIGVGQRKEFVMKYNIKQKVWENVMTLKIPRYAHTCALINNKIVISGGIGYSGGAPFHKRPAKTELIYVQSWTSRILEDKKVYQKDSCEEQCGFVTFKDQERLVSFGWKCKIWNDLKEEWEFVEPELRLNRSECGILSLPSTMLISC